MTMANRPVPVPPTPKLETAVVELAPSDVKTLLNLLRAQFLMDPGKVLGLIATVNPSDCDTTPIFLTLQLSPLSTTIIELAAPPGTVGIVTGGFLSIDTPGVISVIVSVDGKPIMSLINSPAVAGIYYASLPGYWVGSVLQYAVINSHVGTVVISVELQGAFLSIPLWDSIKAQLTQLRKQLIPT
jgi:hypothetical protein